MPRDESIGALPRRHRRALGALHFRGLEVRPASALHAHLPAEADDPELRLGAQLPGAVQPRVVPEEVGRRGARERVGRVASQRSSTTLAT